MGAEHSNTSNERPKEILDCDRNEKIGALQKRYTIQGGDINFTGGRGDNRPNSPPMSVCSDSDLPYISYTDRIQISDSPKIRSKYQVSKSTAAKGKYRKDKFVPGAHNIVVVKSAAKEQNLETDSDFIKLQKIPMFLPVMRGSLLVPFKRDPEILDRLQSIHLQNMCCRMQTHFNVSASYVANEQNFVTKKIRKIDKKINKLFLNYIELQKAYSTYAEVFSKTKLITQQLSRCNTFLNHNIAGLEQLNSALEVKDRMEPFIWKTNN